MSQKKDLLQEAITAAKQVRDAAVKNAVKELEESLTPSIKAMLAHKLDEEVSLDENEEETIEENGNSGFKEVKVKGAAKKEPLKEEGEKTNSKEDEEPDGDEDGGVATGDHKEPDGDEPEEDEEPDGDENGGKATGNHEEPDGDEPEEKSDFDDDTELKDITIGDLKDVIADIVAQISGTEKEAAPGGDEGVDMQPADVEGSGEEEAPLDNAEQPIETPEEEDDDKKKDDEIDLSEILKELETEQKERKNRKVVADSKEVDKLRKENQTYKKAVKELKESLQGTNLINAKLLYATRMMSTKNLTESQKVRVIRSFDVAQTPEEVKIVYKTLNESLKADAKKSVVAEHKDSHKLVSEALNGKVAGSTACKKEILAVDPMVKRFQQLAGIID